MDYENFADLALEHTVMLEFLAKGIDVSSTESWPIFLSLLEAVHHHKEEYFLFPLLLGSERLQVGGPKCMTFFTPRVLGGTGWEDGFAQLRALISPEEIPPIESLSSFRSEVFISGSMLKIPLEDHIIGAAALRRLSTETDPALRFKLFNAFKCLLKDHIQREDECLFELFRKALSPAQKKEYASKAGAFDALSDTENLLRKIQSA